MREPIVFDRAPGRHCHRSKLVVGEINCRHGQARNWATEIDEAEYTTAERCPCTHRGGKLLEVLRPQRPARIASAPSLSQVGAIHFRRDRRQRGPVAKRTSESMRSDIAMAEPPAGNGHRHVGERLHRPAGKPPYRLSLSPRSTPEREGSRAPERIEERDGASSSSSMTSRWRACHARWRRCASDRSEKPDKIDQTSAIIHDAPHKHPADIAESTISLLDHPAIGRLLIVALDASARKSPLAGIDALEHED